MARRSHIYAVRLAVEGGGQVKAELVSVGQEPLVALVLGGGGALGAFEAGVYEALEEGGIAPDWLAGTSLGALNAALIAGNPAEHRLERLREFWTLIAEAAPRERLVRRHAPADEGGVRLARALARPARAVPAAPATTFLRLACRMGQPFALRFRSRARDDAPAGHPASRSTA